MDMKSVGSFYYENFVSAKNTSPVCCTENVDDFVLCLCVVRIQSFFFLFLSLLFVVFVRNVIIRNCIDLCRLLNMRMMYIDPNRQRFGPTTFKKKTNKPFNNTHILIN